MTKKAKPRTHEQQERDTDRRLLRTYGITLAEYNERLAQQGGGCAICGKPAATKRLHTDHCHKFAKQFKIVREKIRPGQYLAYARHRTDETCRLYVQFTDTTAKAAAHAVKQALKKHAVRGILCWPCNRGLRVFWDNPKTLESAARYLRKFSTQTI
jgi:hypothetical protein